MRVEKEIKVNTKDKSKKEVLNEIIDQVSEQLDKVYEEQVEKKDKDDDKAFVDLHLEKVDDESMASRMEFSGTTADLVTLMVHGLVKFFTKLKGFEKEDIAFFATQLMLVASRGWDKIGDDEDDE